MVYRRFSCRGRVVGPHGIKLPVILYTVHYPQRYVTFVKSSRVGHIVSFFQNVNTQTSLWILMGFPETLVPILPRLPYPLGVPNPGYVPYPRFWIYPQNPDKNHVFDPQAFIGKIPLKYGFSLPPFGYLISGWFGVEEVRDMHRRGVFSVCWKMGVFSHFFRFFRIFTVF